MKNNLLIFLIVLVFLVSCAGTPDSNDIFDQQDSSVEEIEELPEPEDVDIEPLPDEELFDEELPEEELPEEEIFEEEAVTEDTLSQEDMEIEDLSGTEDSAVEERLTSIEESLSIIEERLASIAEALLAERPLPSMPEEVPEPEPAPEPEPLPEPEPPPDPEPPLPPPPDLLDPAEERVSVSPVTPSPAEEAQPDQAGVRERQSTIPFRNEPPVPDLTVLTPSNDEIAFSRIVRATVGQIIEIPFRGNGWVYMGELASRRGIVYNSTRREPEGQSIIFRSEEAGTYILRFYRRDHIRDYVLNDYVQVIVGEAPAAGAGWFSPPIDRGRVVAEPRWPSALEEAAIQRGNLPGARPAAPSVETPVTSVPAAPLPAQEISVQPLTTETAFLPVQPQTEPPSAEAALSELSPTWLPPAIDEPLWTDFSEHGSAVFESPSGESLVPDQRQILPPDELLRQAREAFNAGNASAAITLLDQFGEHYPGGNDELYWLYGQFYEANTLNRNIMLSLDYYRRLVREYPQSIHHNDARRRIAYLERFYINIQ